MTFMMDPITKKYNGWMVLFRALENVIEAEGNEKMVHESSCYLLYVESSLTQ